MYSLVFKENSINRTPVVGTVREDAPRGKIPPEDGSYEQQNDAKN